MNNAKFCGMLFIMHLTKPSGYSYLVAKEHHSIKLAYLYLIVSEKHICLEKLKSLVDNIKIRVYNIPEHW